MTHSREGGEICYLLLTLTGAMAGGIADLSPSPDGGGLATEPSVTFQPAE